VSSILRALKKLENDPRHLEENRPLDSKFVPLADTEPHRSYPGIFMVVLGGGIVCGLVILAGWWLLSEKPQPPPAATQQASRTSSKLVESRAPALDINKPQVQTAPEKPVEPLMEQPESPRKTEPAVVEESVAQEIQQENVASVEVQTPEKTGRPQETPVLKTDGQIGRPAKKPVIASVSIPVTPPKTVALEIPRLKDPDMKLQAVTWSRAPQKRIAVINNRILREGEMVSGYLISKINQDDVVLSLDGEKWKLLFR